MPTGDKPGAGWLLAEFDSPGALLHACEAVREAGFKKWDAHSPFPVHGLDRAMGLRPSRLPWIVLVMALSGGTMAMVGQWWVSAVDYPLVIAGKPLFSWQAFIPITFEITVLFGAFAAVLGILGFSRLPALHNPLFESARFERVTNDRFFISIHASDARFDGNTTRVLLEEAGARHIEALED